MLRTLEDGVHTADVVGPHTTERVGTAAFARAVVARLGQRPAKLTPVSYKPGPAAGRKDVRAPRFVVPEVPTQPVRHAGAWCGQAKGASHVAKCTAVGRMRVRTCVRASLLHAGAG